MFDISKPQQENLGPQQKDDGMEINDSKSRWWQSWEEKLLISLRKAGKTYREISKKLPGRSIFACQRRIYDLLESRNQAHSPRQKDDLMRIQDSGQKKWQAWEEELLISLFKVGKTYREVSQQIPGRSGEACRVRLNSLLKAGKQDIAEIPVGGRVWKDWEDQLITTNYDAGKRWAEICKLLPSRTKHSILGRWKTHLKSRVHRSTRTHSNWSQKEDQLLVNLHTAGEDWAEIAGKIPNRSKAGCINRWGNLVHCHPELSKIRRQRCRWTKLEKEILVSLVNAIGPRYYEIAKNLPGRTERACKIFYAKHCAKETETSGPSREYWLRSWDSELLFHST